MRYEWLLFGHLLGAFLWVAGGVVAAFLRVAAMRRSDPREIAVLLRAVRPAVPTIGIGLLLVLLFGFLLADEGSWSLGEPWLSITFALLLYSVVVGAVAGRQDRHTRELAETLAATDARASDELSRRLRDTWNLVLSGSTLVATVVMVALMVFKPGA